MNRVFYLFARDETGIPDQASLLAALRAAFGAPWWVDTKVLFGLGECLYVHPDETWSVRVQVSGPEPGEPDEPGDFSGFYKTVRKTSPFDFTHARRYVHVVFGEDPEDEHTTSSGLVLLEWLQELIPGSVIYACSAKTLL